MTLKDLFKNQLDIKIQEDSDSEQESSKQWTKKEIKENLKTNLNRLSMGKVLLKSTFRSAFLKSWGFHFFKGWVNKPSLNIEIKKEIWVTHPFLMVESTWMPFLLGNAVFFFLFNLVSFFHKGVFLQPSFLTLLVFILIIGSFWIYGVCSDSLFYKQRHTKAVQQNYLTGVSLFILSEMMIFFGFFWAFFHASLNPSFFLGNVWPPVGITPLNPWGIPFLNTIILLFSGITVNIFYYNLKSLADHWKFNFQRGNENEILPLKANEEKEKDTTLEYVLVKNLFFFANLMPKYKVLPKLPYSMESSFWLKKRMNKPWMVRLKHKPLTNLTKYPINDTFQKFNLINSSFRWDLLFVNYQFINLSILPLIDHLKQKFTKINHALLFTQLLGLLFLGLQLFEYKAAPFTITDSVYGSIFYMLTGLHGSHVFIGFLLLVVDFLLIRNPLFWIPHISSHVFITFSVWYWHFVDIIWIFVFSLVYVWGN